jgi:H+/Cl- antiporter ClcA
MPSKEPTPRDRQGLHVGDRVQILTNVVKAPVGTLGTIMGFSAGAQHPLVQIAGRGRCLIPALSLRREDPATDPSRP